MAGKPQHVGFHGRRDEYKWLRSCFEAVAKQDSDGKFTGARLAVILGESGLGKSRLVQELYITLANDEVWDPEEVNYWPDAFGDDGVNLRAVPDMKGHVPNGQPRFAWLGARWRSPDERNAIERRSALPDLRSSIVVHAEILKSHGSAWADAAARMSESVRKHGFGESLGAAADLAGLPFFGLISKLVMGTKDLVADRIRGPMSFDTVERDKIRSEVDEALDCMRLLLTGKGAIPTVLWLDDAHWMDGESQKFLHQLWMEAEEKKWPLLIVVTHWEREWLEEAKVSRSVSAGYSLQDLVKGGGVEILELKSAKLGELHDCLVERLPGLTAPQRSLLVERAGGNFLTMIENVGELQAEPMWFEGERVDGSLTEDAIEHIRKFKTKREERVRQRFHTLEAEVKKILGWSTQIGPRFMVEIVEEFAREKLQALDPSGAIEKCVDPYVVLGRPSPLLREFRDKAYHEVASEFRLRFLKGDSHRLSAVLRQHLVEWVNNSFDTEGNAIWPDKENGIQAPVRSATSLEQDERRELLATAVRELPLPASPDWANRHHIAAVRGVYLLVFIDRQDSSWNGVFRLCEALSQVPFDSVPDTVLATKGLLWLADSAKGAGALEAAGRIAAVVLARRRLLAEKVVSPESLYDLSVSLNLVADIERERGDLYAALTKYRHVLEIRLDLNGEDKPHERLRALSVSLSRVADLEHLLGYSATALEKYKVSFQIFLQLADELRSPDSMLDLSMSLMSLAQVERALGNTNAALAKYLESLKITSELVEVEMKDPQRILRALSTNLNNIANIERSIGNTDTALTTFRDSLEIARKFVGEADSPENEGVLSVSLHNVAGIEYAGGKTDAALAMFRESLEIDRRLAQKLGTPESLRNLSASLNNVAGIERASGDTDAALEKFRESAEINRRLVKKLENQEEQRDLSLRALNVSLNKAASIEYASGNTDTALAMFRESLELSRSLAHKLGTPENLRSLSVSLNNVAGIEHASGDTDAALEKFRESVEINRRLAKKLENQEEQRDMSLRTLNVSLNKAASIEYASGNTDTALAMFRESLELSRSLAHKLGTPENLRSLSVSLHNVAGIERASGDTDAALEKFRESLEIRRRLAQQIGTKESLQDLSTSLNCVADIEEARGDFDSALAKFDESLEILRLLR